MLTTEPACHYGLGRHIWSPAVNAEKVLKVRFSSLSLSEYAFSCFDRPYGRMSGHMAPSCQPPSSPSSCSTTASSPSDPSPTSSLSARSWSSAGGWPCMSSVSPSAARFPSSGCSTSTRQPRDNASTSTSSSSAMAPPVLSPILSSC